MKFTAVCIILAMAIAGCSSKKKETTPQKTETAEKKPEPEPAPKPAPKPVVTPVKHEPEVVIKDKGGLTDAEITLVRNVTQGLINKVINKKVDVMVDKLAAKMGKDNLSKTWPLFIKGAIKSFTAAGVKLVVEVVVKKVGKKVTSEIIERIVKPMIQKAAKDAMDKAYAKVMGN